MVVIFFLLAAAIPRWTVPPPAYDVILRGNTYEQPTQRVSIEFLVRDGRVQATIRPVQASMYPTRSTLFRFDHRTMKVTRIAVDVPDLKEGEPARTRPHIFLFVIDSLRRDYLSTYNHDVSFTPAFDPSAVARELPLSSTRATSRHSAPQPQQMTTT